MRTLAVRMLGSITGPICVADVGALHAEQQLPLLHVVVEARLNVDDPAVGQGYDGDLEDQIHSTRQFYLSSEYPRIAYAALYLE